MPQLFGLATAACHVRVAKDEGHSQFPRIRECQAKPRRSMLSIGGVRDTPSEAKPGHPNSMHKGTRRSISADRSAVCWREADRFGVDRHVNLTRVRHSLLGSSAAVANVSELVKVVVVGGWRRSFQAHALAAERAKRWGGKRRRSGFRSNPHGFTRSIDDITKCRIRRIRSSVGC
jgi:poly(3-hydroxybutyrate) depolymerase